MTLVLNQNTHTHKKEKKTKQKSLVYIQTLKIEHAGHNRGWTSRVSQQPYRTTEHSYSGGSAVITKHQRAFALCRRSALLTAVPPPLLVRPSMLVILRVERGGYLFLHEPQLITQTVVCFHELLDFCFRGREGGFHLQVFLHSDGSVWEVRVQAL